MAWKLEDWSVAIDQIIHALKQSPNRSEQRKIFSQWRSRLEGPPTLLQAYQVDIIMREVQRRLRQTPS